MKIIKKTAQILRIRNQTASYVTAAREETCEQKTGERSDFGIYKIEQNKNFVQFRGYENGLSPVLGFVLAI